MEVYEHVSVSHGTSSSESDGGEAVEATLRALAALKEVRASLSPRNKAGFSHKSRSSHSKANSYGYQASIQESKSHETEPSYASSSMSSESKQTNDDGTAAVYSKKEPTSVSKSFYDKQSSQDIHPYRVPSREEPDTFPVKNQRRGLFSCCFRADEQIVDGSMPPFKSLTGTSQGSQALHQEENAKSTQNPTNEDGEQPAHGLTQYERAMIERLRELLSLDTSIPTLPTQVDMQSKATPISLDITNSMLTRSYSIDTKEKRTLQTTPYSNVGAVGSYEKESLFRQLQTIDQSSRSAKPKTAELLTRETKILRQGSRTPSESASNAASVSKDRASKPNESSSHGNSRSRRSAVAKAAFETVSLGSRKLYLSEATNQDRRGLPPKPEHSAIPDTHFLPKKGGSKVDRFVKSQKSSASRPKANADGDLNISSLKSSRSLQTASTSSKTQLKLQHSRTSTSNGSSASRQSRDIEHEMKNNVLPPKPEASRVREGLETIVQTTSSNEPGFEKQDGFECIFNIKEEVSDFGEIRQVHSELIPPRYQQVSEVQVLRRVTTAKPRLSSIPFPGNCIDENTPSVARAASNLLAKGPKDIRDDISALSALSPKNPNGRPFGPRKVQVLDALSGGVFCCNADVSNAVISP